MNYFFTADEHYGHTNIIKYCNRPFSNIKKMDDEIINRHNEIVGSGDMVFHIGDFTLLSSRDYENYSRRLKGKHVFIRGSHDNWMNKDFPADGILEITIYWQIIILCHYAMRVWDKSHYNSWQLFGHSHGKLKEEGKQLDVGVDTNNFYPYSFEQIKKIMDKKPDNFNLIK